MLHVSRVCYLVSTSGLLCLSTVCEGKLRRHSAASKVPRMALRYGRRVLACGREHSSRERGVARSNNEMRSFNKCLGYLDAPHFTTFTAGYVSSRVTYHVLETRAPRVVRVRKLVGGQKKGLNMSEKSYQGVEGNYCFGAPKSPLRAYLGEQRRRGRERRHYKGTGTEWYPLLKVN